MTLLDWRIPEQREGPTLSVIPAASDPPVEQIKKHLAKESFKRTAGLFTPGRETCKPVRIGSRVDHVAIEIGSAVGRPHRASFAERPLCSIDQHMRCAERVSISRSECGGDRPAGPHQLADEPLTFVGRQRWIGSAPETVAYDQVATVTRDRTAMARRILHGGKACTARDLSLDIAAVLHWRQMVGCGRAGFGRE